MKILPTINLQNACAVPIFGNGASPCEPMEVVSFLLEQGHRRLALVDVDAAMGKGHNRELIARMMRRFHKGVGKACIQVTQKHGKNPAVVETWIEKHLTFNPRASKAEASEAPVEAAPVAEMAAAAG